MTPQEQFKEAIEKNNLTKIQLLLNDNRFDPSAYNNYYTLFAIVFASQNGHSDIVKLLLSDPRVDPTDDNNFSIIMASKNGHREVVKLLLNDNRIIPAKYSNYAIQQACQNGHTDIVQLLWQNKKVKNTLKYDNLELYNKLIQRDITNKLNGFY